MIDDGFVNDTHVIMVAVITKRLLINAKGNENFAALIF